MKTKHVKILSLLLATLLMLGIFSGCGAKSDKDDIEGGNASSENESGKTESAEGNHGKAEKETAEWVMTHEKNQYNGGSEDLSYLYDIENSYNAEGQVIYSKTVYNKERITISYNYKYDKNGNLISYSSKTAAVGTSDFSDFTDYTYKYDANGNCVSGTCKKGNSVEYSNNCEFDENGNCITKITLDSEGKTQFIYEHEYDDKGNVIKTRTRYYTDDTCADENINTYKLTYENGRCVFNESTSVDVSEDETIVYHTAWQYEYDTHGNKTAMHYYSLAEDADNMTDTVEINGKNYKLLGTNEYTYEKLKDVATDEDSINFDA